MPAHVRRRRLADAAALGARRRGRRPIARPQAVRRLRRGVVRHTGGSIGAGAGAPETGGEARENSSSGTLGGGRPIVTCCARSKLEGALDSPRAAALSLAGEFL